MIHPDHHSRFDPDRREPLLRLKDNPILIAQMRAQLRHKKGVGTIQITGLLSLLLLLGTFVVDGSGKEMAWPFAMRTTSWLMFFFLYWRGANYLMEAVYAERERGIFTFLRSTPMSSLTIAFGYLLGGASRAYLGALTLTPAWFITGIQSGYSLSQLLITLTLFFLGALILHGLMLPFALTGHGQPKWTLRVFILGLYFISGSLSDWGFQTIAHLTPIPGFISLGISLWGTEVVNQGVAFFSFNLSHLAYTLIVQGLTLGVCLWIAARKIERDNQPGISRLGGLMVWSLIGLLFMGVDLNPGSSQWLQLANVSFAFLPGGVLLLILSLVAGMGMLWISTPQLITFQRASARQGQERDHLPSVWLPWHTEGASLLVLCFVHIALITVLISGYFIFHGGFNALQIAFNTGLVPSVCSVCVALLAFSGISEHASALTRTQSYSLTMWVRLSVLFLLPLIIALVAQGFREYSWVEPVSALSPFYALIYSMQALMTGTGVASSAGLSIELNFNYYLVSLATGMIVAYRSYYRAHLVKTELLKLLQPTDHI